MNLAAQRSDTLQLPKLKKRKRSWASCWIGRPVAAGYDRRSPHQFAFPAVMTAATVADHPRSAVESFVIFFRPSFDDSAGKDVRVESCSN